MKRLHIALLIAFISTIAGLGQDATASSAPSAPEPQSSQQPPPPHVVDLKSADGTILKGTYFAAAKPGPGVVLLHQINRDRKSWEPVAAQLAAAGINALTLDLRASAKAARLWQN